MLHHCQSAQIVPQLTCAPLNHSQLQMDYMIGWLGEQQAFSAMWFLLRYISWNSLWIVDPSKSRSRPVARCESSARNWPTFGRCCFRARRPTRICIHICHRQNWWPLSDLAYLAHHSYCILNLQTTRFDPSKLRQWLATFQHHTFITERRGLGMLLFETNTQISNVKSERLSDLSLKLSLSHLSVCNHIPFLHLRISQVFLLFGCVSRFLR